MEETIESVKLKLIKEIREESEALEEVKKKAIIASREEYAKNRYGEDIRNRRESIDIKLKLLNTLNK